MSLEAYLASLPEAETTRMPRGTLFVADHQIYQIIEAHTNAGAFAKARQWRKDESTDVALVAGSLLTKTLPLVSRGRLLPVFRSRAELTDNGKPRGYLFPTEKLAKDAAYFDVALIINGSAYVRNRTMEPGFSVTDGVQVFRLYYFMRSEHGRETHLTSMVVENPRVELQSHMEGPMYWRLLKSWLDTLPATSNAAQARLTQPALHPVSPTLNDDTTQRTTQLTRAVPQELPEANDVTQESRAVRNVTNNSATEQTILRRPGSLRPRPNTPPE